MKNIFFLKVGILRRFGEYYHSSLSGFKDTFIKISDSRTRMERMAVRPSYTHQLSKPDYRGRWCHDRLCCSLLNIFDVKVQQNIL